MTGCNFCFFIYWWIMD